MLWSSWLRNLWGARGPAKPKVVDPLATVDLPGPLTEHGGSTPRLAVGVVSTVGNHREHNEDNYFVPGRPSLRNGVLPGKGNFDSTVDSDIIAAAPPIPPPHTTMTPPGVPGLFIVADGMGGQLGGEVASQMAVELIPKELSNRLEPDADDRRAREAIREAVAAANREVVALSHVNTDVTNLGTTVVLLLFRGDRAYLANFGDSRAYRLRDGRIEQLTKDHSLAKALVDAGTIPPEEEERHKFKNVLYLYLGSNDARDGPEVRTLDVRAGDRYLLCSDGLTGWVKDDRLAEALRSGDDPQRSADYLVQLALANQSKDNVTAVVIHTV